MEGSVEDVSTTNPEAYSASLANVVSVLIFCFFYPGSHVDGIFPPRCRYLLKKRHFSSLCWSSVWLSSVALSPPPKNLLYILQILPLQTWELWRTPARSTRAQSASLTFLFFWDYIVIQKKVNCGTLKTAIAKLVRLWLSLSTVHAWVIGSLSDGIRSQMTEELSSYRV